MAGTGLFDDLIPANAKPKQDEISSGRQGLFDDLIPDSQLSPQGSSNAFSSSASPSPAGAERGPIAQPLFSGNMMQDEGFGDPEAALIAGANDAPAPRIAASGPELRAWEPTITDRIMGLIPGNRARAANEYAARQIARERGTSVDQVYRDAGGSRPMFNPEGRPAIQATVEASRVAAESVPEIPRAAANTALRAVRGGDLPVKDKTWLDRAITATERDKTKKVDPNYESFSTVGDSLGYSLTTMVSSALAFAGTTATTGNPVAGGVAAFGTSGAVSYRASKDEFLDRVREKLNKDAVKLYGRELNEQEWAQALKDFDSAATQYGAWEAIPEAVSNLVFLKAFSAPLKAVNSAQKLEGIAKKAALTLGSEQGTETITALGQNRAERQAGLTTDELSVVDAFKQQFIQTLITTGTIGGGAKSMQLANDFYKNQVEPRVAPGSALARAIKADIDAVAFDPQAIERNAVDRLSPDRAQLVAKPVTQNLFSDLIPEGTGQVAAAAAATEPPAQPDDQVGQSVFSVQLGGQDQPAVATPPDQTPPDETQAAQPLTTTQQAEPRQAASFLVDPNNAGPSPIQTVGVELTGDELAAARKEAYKASIADMSNPIPEGVTLTQVEGPNGTEYQVRWKGQIIGITSKKPSPINWRFHIMAMDRLGSAQLEPQAMVDALRAYKNKDYQKANSTAKYMLDFYGYLMDLPGAKMTTSIGDAVLKAVDKMPANIQADRRLADAFIRRAFYEAQVKASAASAPANTPQPATPAPTVQAPAAAAPSEVSTVTGRKINVEYALVEADDLVAASEDLQPRDRSRTSSDAQIAEIASKLDPARLGVSAEADRGAPIIGPDNIIESGNGRVMAIRRAYDMVPERSQAYRDYLVQAGYPEAANMRRPVLVRRRTTELTPEQRREFVIEANQSATMQMSSTERAQADQSKLTRSVMELWRGGEVSDSANRDFVRAFIQNVVPSAEQNSILDANGNLSVEGKRRIEAAMLGRAYGDPELLAKLVESLDNNIRSIGGALLDVAGEWMNMRQAVIDGQVPERFDVTQQLVDAVRILDGLRQSGQKIQEYLAQTSMFGDRDPATDAFLRSFFNEQLTRAVGRDNVYAVLSNYSRQALQQSDDSLFGGELPTVQPNQIIDQATETRNAANRSGGETQTLFEESPGRSAAAGQGADADGQTARRGALRDGGQGADRQGDQPASARGRAGRQRTQGQNETGNQPETETNRVEEDGGAAGQELYEPLSSESQREASEKAAGRTAPEQNQRFRGTSRQSLLLKVSFTDRQSIYRNAFAELGYDPTQAELLPPARQFQILRDGLKKTYGLAFVEKTDRSNLREAIDQLLDAYRGMQLMAYVTELPSKAIGLEGTLGLVLRRKVEYLGAYYPMGGEVEGTVMSGPAVVLPRRSNSFAHEWGHAFDYWLLGKYSNMTGTLTQAVRDGEDLTQSFPENVRDAYALVVRSLFFDRAIEAQQIMELERKIEIAKTDEQRAKLQAKLDQVLAGASKDLTTRSRYYKQQKEFVDREGGDVDYWRKPTEMLARAFEAYISFKVEGAGGSTEFLGKGTEAYQSDAISRLELTFPKDADRFNIFRAFDLLFDAVREDAVLNPNNEPAANMPDDVVLSNPAMYFRDPVQSTQSPTMRRVFENERDELVRQRRAHKRQAERPSDGKSFLQRMNDLTKAATQTNRGVLLGMEGRYKRQGNAAAADAIWNITRRITTDPGSGRSTFAGGTYAEAVQRETFRFENRLDRIIKDFKIDEFTNDELKQLRDVLTAINDEPLKAPAKITEAAAPLRILLNDLHNLMTQAGVDVGYTEQGYLTRILDEPVIMDNPSGFQADAKKVYEVIFERDTPNFEDGEISPEKVSVLLKRMREAGIDKKDPQFDEFRKLVRQYRKLLRAFDKAEKADDPDEALAKATEDLQNFVDDNIDKFQETYNEVEDIWTSKAAADWLQRILYGSPAGWESNSPSGHFLKQRKLPPEADKLLTDWYIQDPSETIRTYLRGSTRKSEYNRRFGKQSGAPGNTQMDQLLEALRMNSVTREDVAYIEKIISQEIGMTRGGLPQGLETFLNTTQTIGTMALLGRVVLTSLAEPIAVGFQTGNAFDGFKALASTVREILPTASVREKRALARALGVVASPYAQDILSNRFGGQYREDPKLSRASARYYARVGLTGLTNAQRRSAMQLGIGYFATMAETITDPDASKSDKDAARREFADFGIQPSMVDEFSTWMLQFSNRIPALEEITDVNGQLTEFGLILSTGIARLVDQSIQNPKAADRPFAANTTVGRITYGLLSFNMAFFRNIMVKSWKKIAREAEAGGAGRGAYIAVKAVAFPAMALYGGHFIVTMMREALLNPDKWDEQEENGTLWPYLVGLAFTRAGFTGLADPFYNAILSLKYQRDLSNLAIGPVGAYILANLQKIIGGFVLPNSDKNNKVETSQLKALYELTFQPAFAYGVGALPGGPVTGASLGILYGYLSSPAFKSQFAEFFVGPKDTTGRQTGEGAGF